MPKWSWRLEQAELSRLAWAFIISLTLHVLVFGGYYTGNKFNLWQRLHWPAWLQSVRILADLLHKKQPPPPDPQSQQLPLLFVDVSPAQATTEAPKKADYYSDKNSKAANPDASLDSNIPKIDGQQTEIVKTEDVPRSKAFPLQPAPTPPVATAKEAQEELKPKPAYTPGDLTMAKPDLTPRKDEGQAEQPRPRTIEEALARRHIDPQSLAGLKMKQEGGVRRRYIESSLDVVATAFGAYDAAIIRAVQNRWYDLLDSRNYVRDLTGKVKVSFHLNSDGSITEMKLLENTVDLTLALLCESAIKDPSPYAPWPSDMRRQVGVSFRPVTFTFYYY